ncbi:probable transcriptional regulator SLK2 [Nymphaea colorata]|nr:probable transcriptional regulator SLK2 [Nymphaea colorata]
MNRVLNSGGNSGPSVGASSLVTDANSALSGGAHLQRSASINADSYMRLPASPMSFSSGNISISGSSIVEGSSIVQQSGSSVNRMESQQEQNSHQLQQRQQQRASSATSLTTQQLSQHQVVSPMIQVPGAISQPGNHPIPYVNQQSMMQLAGQALGAFNQDPKSMLAQHNQIQKCRLDARQDDLLQQHLIQQFLQRSDAGLVPQIQRQDSVQLQGLSPHIQAMLQQQRLLQRHQLHQQQLLQCMTPMQRTHLQQQQQQPQQLHHHLQQQNIPQISGVKRPYESGACALRLMKYIFHQRQRPPDNNILYWRKFVAEYFAPHAKKRWCLSAYDNMGQNTLGVFPQSAMDTWQCEICGSKSGKGFETTVEVLPRLNKIKFDSGVLDELLFVDMPQEHRLPSGIMLLECSKAIQQSVYEKLRVIREGRLRIVFGPDMKILSWEFCARRHEEFLLRRLVTPQVHQLLQATQKYQTAVSESGSSGLPLQDLQTNCDMFVEAGNQLARVLESQALNDFGFSKRYIRCLQISEVVNSMKDLIDFCQENKGGPIESLKSYPRHAATSKKLKMEQMMGQGLATDQTSVAKMMAMNSGLKMEQMMGQGLATDQTSVAKMMAMNSGLSNRTNSTHLGSGVLCGSTPPGVGLTGYQNLLRQSSINSNSNVLSQDASLFGSSNQVPSQSSQFQGPISSVPVSLQNMTLRSTGSSSAAQPASLNPNLLQTIQPQPSQQNQPLQHHVLQQMMQNVLQNSGVSPMQCTNVNAVDDAFPGTSGSAILASRGSSGNVPGFGSSNLANNAISMIPSRSNSFKSTASNPMNVGGNAAFNLRSSPDVSQTLHLPDLVPDISHEFAENGIFSGEPADMSYGWKA